MSNIVPTSGLNEAFRVELARTDLTIIVDQAREQVAVHETAVRAASEVIRAVSEMEVPNRDALRELDRDDKNSDVIPDVPETISGIARRLIKPKGDVPVGVSDKQVKADALSSLHPDRRVDMVDTSKDDLFKSITEAQQSQDVTLTQGLYASTVASVAAGIEKPTPQTLEIAWYKAYLALQAGQGRFKTVEEIEVWKECELAIAPYKLRANLLGMVSNIFAQSLGADEHGAIMLPSESSAPISEGFDTAQRVIKKIFGDELKVEDLSSKIALFNFDKELEALIPQLKGMLEHRPILTGTPWSAIETFKASHFGRELASIARTLEGGDVHMDIAKFILQGLGPSLFDRDPKIKPTLAHDEDKIISNEHYKENVNNSIHYYNDDKHRY